MSFISINCAQFIYGRDLSKKPTFFDIVDYSPNFHLNSREKYISKFKGIRSGEVFLSSSDEVFFASKTSEGELIIGRFARSMNKEITRNYYQQEHYCIFPKSEVDKWGGKLLFFLQSLPIPKTYYSVGNNMDSQLQIKEDDFSSEKRFELINNIEIDNRYELITTIINSLLQGEEILVNMEDLFHTIKWDLINLIFVIIPMHAWLNNGLFIGPHYPNKWKSDLTFLPFSNPAKQISKINVMNPNSFKNSLNDFFTYSNLIVKCLQYNRTDLAITLQGFFCELIRKYISTNHNLNQRIKKYLPSDIVTQILILIVKNESVPIDDVFWYWRNGFLYLDSTSLEVLFPILARNLRKWNSNDFQITNRLLLVENLYLQPLIEKFVFSKADDTQDFVYGFIINNSNFNDKQIIFIFKMLTSLANFNAGQSLVFLIELLKKQLDSKYLINIINLLTKIPSSIISNSNSIKSIFFFCTLMCTTDIKIDLFTLSKIAHILQRNSLIHFYCQLLLLSFAKKATTTIADEYDLLFQKYSGSIQLQSEDFIILFHICFIEKSVNLFLWISNTYWSSSNASRESLFQSINKYKLSDFSYLTVQIKKKPIIGTFLLLFLHQSNSKTLFSESLTQILIKPALMI